MTQKAELMNFWKKSLLLTDAELSAFNEIKREEKGYRNEKLCTLHITVKIRRII